VAQLAAKIVLAGPDDDVQWFAPELARMTHDTPALRTKLKRLIGTRDQTASDVVSAKSLYTQNLMLTFTDIKETIYRPVGAEELGSNGLPKSKVVLYDQLLIANHPGQLLFKRFAVKVGASEGTKAHARELIKREASAINAFRIWAGDHPAARAVVVPATAIIMPWWTIGSLQCPGVVVMERMTEPGRDWDASWKFFQGLLAALDALHPTQFWDLKLDNVMTDSTGQVRLIDLDGLRTPDEMQRRLQGDPYPNQMSDPHRWRMWAPMITTTRPPDTSDDKVSARWHLRAPPQGGRFWAADPKPNVGQLEGFYAYVTVWCLVEIGLSLMSRAGTHSLKKSLLRRRDETEVAARPNITAAEARDNVTSMMKATKPPATGAGAQLHAACLALIERGVRFATEHPTGTFTAMAGPP
jgi:hypothetical protein